MIFWRIIITHSKASLYGEVFYFFKTSMKQFLYIKRIFFLCIVAIIWLLTIPKTHALSCASYLSFEDLYEQESYAFIGQVRNISFVPDSTNQTYCNEVGSPDLAIGTYTYTFTVEDSLKGTFEDTTTLKRMVNGINCTRWWACNTLETGKTYAVVSYDGKNLWDGLCSACPYALASEVHLSKPVYNPALDQDCISYYDGCNTCNKAENGTAICTLRACLQQEEPYCITFKDNPSPLGHPDIPFTCIRWYDGCNDCIIEEGEITGCTKRACIHQDVPKCLEHNFIYLEKIHLDLITSAVNKRKETATPVSTENVYNTIQNKRDEINNILMRTTFIIWSPQLIAYQRTLEILIAIEHTLHNA